MISFKAMRRVGLFVLAVLCAAGATGAQTVREDFPVTNGPVTTTVVSGDTLYIAGEFTQVGPATGGGVSFQLPSLALEPGFPKVAGRVYAVAGDGRGGWYIGGSFTSVGGQPRNCLAHIRADRSVSAWNPNVSTFGGAIYALERGSNTVYIGGYFYEVGGQPRYNIAAVDAVTGLVTPWKPIANASVLTMALRGTTLYVGGVFGYLGGEFRQYLAALSIETGKATDWNPGPDFYVQALKVKGKSVFASGFFSSIGGQQRQYLAELDPTTGLASSWNPQPDLPVYSLAFGNGRVYVGGSFTSIGGQPRQHLAELDARTGQAAAWNPGVDGPVYSLATSGYNLYVGGAFSMIAGQSRDGLAMLKTNTGAADPWNPRARDVRVLAVSEWGVFAGGTFTSVGGELRNQLAAIDIATGSVTAWNPDPRGGGNGFNPSMVQALAVDGSTLYVGGDFTSIGGQARNSVAAVDATTGLVTSWDPHVDRAGVTALTVHSGIVYVGGCFDQIGGQLRDGLAAVDAGTGLATDWNPITNSTLGTGLCSSGTILTNGGTVYTNFQTGFFSGPQLRAFDSVTGLQTPWNPDENHVVSSVALGGSVIYAGGFFTRIGGQTRYFLAALDLTAGLATGWYPGRSNHPLADTIGAVLVDDSKVYVVALSCCSPAIIEALDETSASLLWRVNSTPWGGSTLAISDNLLFVGGLFFEIDGVLSPYLAAIQLPQ